MTRTWLVAIAFGLILAGLALRLAAFGLPLWVRHYGGGLLWSALVFVLIASVRPRVGVYAAAWLLQVRLP